MRRWSEFGITSVPDRPERMYRNGRAEDQIFAPAERLFRRYQGEHYSNGQFSNLGLRFDNPSSTNREKYSQAADVLFSDRNEFSGWGVLSFQVQALPAQFPSDGPVCTFSPKHAPLDDNYSHSEVWCDTLPPAGQHTEPSKRIRKLFRAFLSQRVTIEIAAAS